MVIPAEAVTTHQDLYEQVWSRVSYLVTPLPPSDAAAPNHAQDWSVVLAANSCLFHSASFSS